MSAFYSPSEFCARQLPNASVPKLALQALAFTLYTLHSTPYTLPLSSTWVADGIQKSFPLGEDLGEASSHHYEITIRLVCDNYVIQTTSMEHVQTKITSTASATTSYHVQFLPAQTAISAKIQRGYLG